MNKVFKVLVCLMSPLALMSCQCLKGKKDFSIEQDSILEKVDQPGQGDFVVVDKKDNVEKVVKIVNKICFQDDGKKFCKKASSLEEIKDYLSGAKTDTKDFEEVKAGAQ